MNRRLLPLAGLAMAVAMAASACSLTRLPHETPTIPPLPQTSRIYDNRGHLITSLHAGEDRTLVSISTIPKIVQNAIVAAEDERFYQHHGVDAKALLRAALHNAESGKIVEGGSTITEQLVKNTITGDDRTLGRKFKEAQLAYQLENQYSKDQILEMYLNTVYFGQGAYGIEAAAKTYFSVPAAKLTLSQAALLAGVISSPSNYDPVFHPSIGIDRRNIVLQRMLDQGYIDRAEYEDTIHTDLGLKVADDRTRYPAGYFVDYVKRWFLSNPEFGDTYEERYVKLFEGGLRITTTVDLKLQREAEAAVNDILRYSKDPYGAMTVLDPRTGEVKAMVGGRDFFSESDPFAKLNLATGGATGRQAGSAFKPFALVTALERGVSPLAVYPAPSHMDILLPQGFDPQTWPVDNYDGEGGGSETLERATINSVNTVYAQVIMQVGAANVVETAKRMGITSRLAAYPSAVLGTNDVNTLEMASAYGTLATMGNHVPPIAVSEITDAAGQVLWEADPKPQPVLDPAIAWTADQILQKVVQEGTGTQANIGRPAAGKTGTAQNWTNAWFVGFVPQLVAAVWVGFPQGQVPMAAPKVRIPHVLGGTWPAEIWHAFMTNATKDLPVEDWQKPEIHYVDLAVDVGQGCLANQWTIPTAIQVVHFIAGTQPSRTCAEPSGPQVVGVTSVVGLSQQDAQQVLQSWGFQVLVVNEPSDSAPAGTVLSQDPSSGTDLLQGSLVTLSVASGPAPSPSPSDSPSPSPTPSPSEGPSPSPTPSGSPSPAPSI